jgi:hypothetical protein
MKVYFRNNSVSIPLLETIGVYYKKKKASRDDSCFTQRSNLSTIVRAHKLTAHRGDRIDSQNKSEF